MLPAVIRPAASLSLYCQAAVFLYLKLSWNICYCVVSCRLISADLDRVGAFRRILGCCCGHHHSQLYIGTCISSHVALRAVGEVILIRSVLIPLILCRHCQHCRLYDCFYGFFRRGIIRFFSPYRDLVFTHISSFRYAASRTTLKGVRKLCFRLGRTCLCQQALECSRIGSFKRRCINSQCFAGYYGKGSVMRLYRIVLGFFCIAIYYDVIIPCRRCQPRACFQIGFYLYVRFAVSGTVSCHTVLQRTVLLAVFTAEAVRCQI